MAMQPGTLAYSIAEGVFTLLVLLLAIGIEGFMAVAYLRLSEAIARRSRKGRLAARHRKL